MITRTEALARVEERINAFDPYRPEGVRLVVIDELTIEKPWGWIFFYNTEAYLRSGNYRDCLAGNAPYIVNQQTGELVETGTAYDLEYYVDQYEAQLHNSSKSG